MRAKRKLAANEVEAYGIQLNEVIEQLKQQGKIISSIERVKGSNSGWIVRWFKPHPYAEGAEFPREKQQELLAPDASESSQHEKP